MQRFDAEQFGKLIHDQRSQLLARLPRDVECMCSAGCSGKWYFDWVEQYYGAVDVHYGVEAYSPQPDDLPENVVWINNTVSALHGIDDGSVDLLFSGQNVEHLLLPDMKGFFHEANRVVREGGYLCVDSPNRTVTAPGGYYQPEHVLEYTTDEAIEIITAAGFRVVDVHGVWNCRTHDGRAIAIDADDDTETRIVTALDKPRDSFIWWIVAEKIGPPSGDLEAIIDKIYLREYQPFVMARQQAAVANVQCASGTEAILSLGAHMSEYVMFGPYIPLAPGQYCADFLYKFHTATGSMDLDVIGNRGAHVLAKANVTAKTVGKWERASLEFEVPYYITGIEGRVLTINADASLRLGCQIYPA